MSNEQYIPSVHANEISLHAIDRHLIAVADYYSARLKEHGACAKGVDWNSIASQELRFDQLNRVINNDGPFVINDLGCGYGAYYDYLRLKNLDFSYVGVDLSAVMIEEARNRHSSDRSCRFVKSPRCDQIADYTVASGIFNVKLNLDDESWRTHMLLTLHHMNEASSRGYAFNCLTRYSDPDQMKPYLYYADPCTLFDYCKTHHSRNVALLHDYGLYEFTVLVKKDS